jgi:CRP-like cAMP-binding protein
VELRRPTKEGPNLLVDDLIAASIFGVSSLMGADRYLLNAECTEDSEVLKIEGKVLRQILDENPVVGYAMQRRVSQIFFKRYLNSTERLRSVIQAIPIRSDA